MILVATGHLHGRAPNLNISPYFHIVRTAMTPNETRIHVIVAVIVSLGLPLSHGFAQRPSQGRSVRIHPEIEYVNNGHERQRLDLFVPESAVPPPLVVWVHGGGWAKGSKTNLRRLSVSYTHLTLPTTPYV